MLCGTDEKGDAHLVCVDGTGAPSDLTDLGFWAIGSGTHAAINALVFHADRNRLSRYINLGQGVYLACEAKFMAESAKTVGKATFVTVFPASDTGKVRFVSQTGVEYLRTLWEANGAPRIPEHAALSAALLTYSADVPQEIRETAMAGKPEEVLALIQTMAATNEAISPPSVEVTDVPVEREAATPPTDDQKDLPPSPE